MAAPRSTVVVTGCAGFIGLHACLRLLRAGRRVVGLDDLGDTREPPLQRARLQQLLGRPGFDFVQGDVADAEAVDRLLGEVRPRYVLHLAARAGVRASSLEPHAFTRANLVGFASVLGGCHRHGVRHLVYASSSSVYGAGTGRPSSEADPADRPLSYYAATKRADELLAHAYGHVHRLPSTGLRFFTVYGPWGRPDMAPLLFARAILRGEPVRLFDGGRLRRDFTYVGDVVEAVVRVLARPPPAGGAEAPSRVLNVGNSSPARVTEFVATLERLLGRPARRIELPMQAGDVPETWADTARLAALTGFTPGTPLAEGLRRTLAWLLEYEGHGAARAGGEDRHPPGAG
jgi:UDP-glucuronate 4-epimerase